MTEDFHLVPLPADAEMGEMLEALGPVGEARAGIAVLRVSKRAGTVLSSGAGCGGSSGVAGNDAIAAGAGLHAGDFQSARCDCAAD